MSKRIRLAISSGDPAGVGPAICVSALNELHRRGELWDVEITLYGDETWFAKRSVPAPVRFHHSASWKSAFEAGHGASADGGAAQLAALADATSAALASEVDALVTAPMSKEAVCLSGVTFTGHTEYLAERSQLERDDVTMIFSGPKLITGLVTTHLALADVPKAITERRILRSLRHLSECGFTLGRSAPIAVAGLNPHAGEAGLLGREEIQTLAPAVAKATNEGLHAAGPMGAESAFRLAYAGNFSSVLAMYHDQATIASKLLDWGQAVNVTWGLPFIRTSVDHGVAYDAAASGNADAEGMQAALRLAIRLARRKGEDAG